jgi:hypothetical protein
VHDALSHTGVHSNSTNGVPVPSNAESGFCRGDRFGGPAARPIHRVEFHFCEAGDY